MRTRSDRASSISSRKATTHDHHERHGTAGGRRLRPVARLSRAQRHAQPVRCAGAHPVRQGQGCRARIRDRSCGGEHHRVPHHPAAAGLPDPQQLLRRRGVRPLLPRVPGSLLCACGIVGLRIRHVPRRVQILCVIRAEDLRRHPIPGGFPAACGRRGAGVGRRRRADGHACGRRDHRGPLPARHPDVPEPGQGAAGRAGQLLPDPHRGQHGIDLARHQRRAPAEQAGRRRGTAAEQPARTGRPDQADRTPVQRRGARDETVGGLVLLRQPVGRAAGSGRGVPQRAPPGHPALPGHQTRECRREDPHQIAGVGRGGAGHHVRTGQTQGTDGAVQPLRCGTGVRQTVRRHQRDRGIRSHGGRRAHPQDLDRRSAVLHDAGRAAVRIRLPLPGIRGHGQPGEPDRGACGDVQSVFGDPAGAGAEHVP